jgi:DNA-3-methyladenine glycosylase
MGINLNKLRRLGRDFFSRYTPEVARDLLGCLLVRKIGDLYLSSIIVEDEAYRGSDDPASHAYRGLTERNKIMFGEAGYAYVYFTYGFHYCLNITTETLGKPGAVLIRAVEPHHGVEIMMKNRGVYKVQELCNGPGKVTKALMIDKRQNGLDIVTSEELFVTERVLNDFEIKTGERIGVSRGRKLKWRFLISGNKFVSKS